MSTIVMNWTLSGNVGASIFEVDGATPDTIGSLEAVRDAYQINLRPIQSTETILDSITLLGPTPVSLAVGNAGTLSGQPSPPNSCYLVNKNMSVGRRGRWFLPGLVEDDTFGNGMISATRRVAVTTATNQFRVACLQGDVNLGIKRTDGLFYGIESFICDNMIGVQRKRLGR